MRVFPMPFSIRVLALALSLGIAVAVVRGAPVADADEERSGPYAPYENLIEVLADFSRHLHDDLYRFPAPQDVGGRSLYAATVDRLDNFRTLHPHEMADVVGFARAEALFRVGSYDASARAFDAVSTLASPLAEPARKRHAVVVEVARVSALPERGATLETTLELMRAKLEQWDRVLERARGTPDECVCRIEEEGVEQRLLTTIIDNRAWLDDGTDTAVRSATFLIAKHADSKNAPAHVIRLADLHATLARECVDARPPSTFDQEAFSDHVAQAVEAYTSIGSLDGIPQKPEAQAKLEALQAYRQQVLALHR
jgi:hypothetical protein